MKINDLFKLAIIVLGIAGIGLFADVNFWERDGQLLTAQIPVTKWQRSLYRYKLKDVKKVIWAGHSFERAILDTNEYRTSGNRSIKFTESGFYAPSYALPRSKILDINMNEKVKVTIRGTLEGELKNLSRFNFSEFAIYLTDENGNAKGLRQLGSKHNAQSPNAPKFKFSGFTVENTGTEIVITDSNDFSLTYSKDFKYVTDRGYKEKNYGGNYGELDPKQKWFLQINCHVNGEGFCRLDLKDIKVTR